MRVARRTAAVLISAVAVTGVVAGTAAAAPAAAPTAKSYTMAQVKTHNKAANCWTVIKGSVYNMTAFEKAHPGGAGPIVAVCGKDGTKAFAAQHGMDAGKIASMSKYKVGTLKK